MVNSGIVEGGGGAGTGSSIDNLDGGDGTPAAIESYGITAIRPEYKITRNIFTQPFIAHPYEYLLYVFTFSAVSTFQLTPTATNTRCKVRDHSHFP
jgi:hypothetical protein